MTLQKWIEDRVIHGFPTFSVEDVRAADLCSSEQILQNELSRLSSNKTNGKKVEKCVLDDSAYFGGILIRQLKCEDGCEVLSGPLACAELFRCYDATGVDHGFPVLVEHDNGTVEYICKPRVNLLRSNQSVEDKVNNILYQYHDNVQSSKETLYQDFINFKDKPYGYEQQIASR